MRADQLLERGDLVHVLPVAAVDDDVGAVREARRCGARARRRAGRTARAGPRPRPQLVVEVVHAAAAPSATAPSRSERTSTKPIPGCARSASSRPGRRARSARASRGRARAGTRSGRGCRTPSPRSRAALRRGFPLSGARRRRASPRVARAGRVRGAARQRRAVALRQLGQAGVEMASAPSSRRPARRDRAPGVARDDQLLERLAVALQERRALRLAVVGQHDEPVGARRVPRRAAIRAIARSTPRSTASVSGRSTPEWWATSS